MIKDIEIPKAEHVYIVAVKEWDTEFTGQDWNIYVVNNRDDIISTVLVLSRGESHDRKTSTLRQNFGDMSPKSWIKIEFIPLEVLGFTNEYLLTFFAGNKLYEQKYIFEPNSISEDKVTQIPVMESEGILAK